MEMSEVLEAAEAARDQLNTALTGLRELSSDALFVKDRRSRIGGLDEVFQQKDAELGQLMERHRAATVAVEEVEARLAKAQRRLEELRKSLGA